MLEDTEGTSLTLVTTVAGLRDVEESSDLRDSTSEYLKSREPPLL